MLVVSGEEIAWGWPMTKTSLPPPRSPGTMLLPFALIVFLGYVAVGIPLSTLPVQVHVAFGYGTATMGAIIGLSVAATLLTRQLAGSVSDRRGPKVAVLLGLGTTALTGLIYLASLVAPQEWRLGILAAGRMLLGVGDSLFTTGVMAWAVTRA